MDNFIPVSGSFTKEFTTDDSFAFSENLFTVTYRYRVRWWKRPWFWIRRKPTSYEQTLTDVRFEQPSLNEDGSVVVAFSGKEKR